MEPANATGGSAWRWLCLERQHLSKLVQGCLCDHGNALEWTEILRPARQTSEGVLTMKTGSTKVVRCAIYTRVSTDQLGSGADEVERARHVQGPSLSPSPLELIFQPNVGSVSLRSKLRPAG